MKKHLFTAVLGAALVVGAAGAQAAGDAAKGEVVFKQCKACHSLEAGKKGVGPSLAGIIGRPSASVEGFAYSDPMKKLGISWDAESISKYSADPKGFVPGNKMAFAGVKNPEQLEDLVAFLTGK